jgi:hypothetical protein
MKFSIKMWDLITQQMRLFFLLTVLCIEGMLTDAGSNAGNMASLKNAHIL